TRRPGRVEMWRGGVRIFSTVAAPFVWRCLNRRSLTPFPHPAHRTGQADFPHPALGRDIMFAPTGDFASNGASAPDRDHDEAPRSSSGSHAGVCSVTSGGAESWCIGRSTGMTAQPDPT